MATKTVVYNCSKCGDITKVVAIMRVRMKCPTCGLIATRKL